MAEPGQKSEWPELVGKDAAEAKAIIEAERPDLTVKVGFYRSPGMWTKDYREERVRVRHDDNDKVTEKPCCG